MLFLGFEPGVAGSKERTNPLSYGLFHTYVFYINLKALKFRFFMWNDLYGGESNLVFLYAEAAKGKNTQNAKMDKTKMTD